MIYDNNAALAVSSILTSRHNRTMKAFVRTYGCQQNVSESERISGMLLDMGYIICDDITEADFIIFNTCAVRENAENRAFANISQLKNLKKINPDLILVLAGCMVQQKSAAKLIREKYKFVDIAIGTAAINRLPQIMLDYLMNKRQIIDIEHDNVIVENAPKARHNAIRAYVPIMQGCDNFCTYCIVPHVKGREISRKSADILAEIEDLIINGVREITLLGQNVNSYGKNLEENVSFADLLRKINAINGDFIVRFMTSHPKDLSGKLLETIAECDKLAKHIHLPFQSGSDEILAKMNRGYTSAQYLKIVEKARGLIPGVQFTSDIIVGFPGETYENFKATLELVKTTRFQSLYTFLYSKREGTKAAEMPNLTPESDKKLWFGELLKLQSTIQEEILHAQIGREFKVLVEGKAKTSGHLTARTSENFVVDVVGDESLVGQTKTAKITGATNMILKGELINE